MIRFNVTIDCDDLGKDLLQKLSLNGEAQQVLDAQIMKDSSRKVPLDMGALQGSVHAHSSPGRIVWQTPYAKRWYYEPARFAGAPERGNHWFERAKAERCEAWVQAVERILKG
ncbi:minor capsid protein [Peptococcus simiae]|uniref:minor capsid protein n=1 Tax=Peptococcus simiae TaxID=1643805 RepID=UPI003980C4EA